MTTEQWERVLDFAPRMARVCFPTQADATPGEPYAEWVEDQVSNFLGSIHELHIGSISGWDDSDPYPEGHQFHWMQPNGWVARAPYLCDEMSEWEWEGRADIRLTEAQAEALDAADDADDLDAKNTLWESIVETWFGPVRACVRAAVDVACKDGPGVVNYLTAGDIRQMYPEGVPDWFTGGTDHRWFEGPLGGPLRENGTFGDMADDTPLAL